MHYPNFTPPQPKHGLIGHRGVAALAPENTLASFRMAAEQGLDWIEFDVRLTKDGTLVIFHDDTLERTTYSIGAVHEMSSAQLALCDAGSWFNHRFAKERIPVLSETLTELLNLNLSMNIELKMPARPNPRHVQKMANELISLLHFLWPKERSLPLISSFHWPLLKKIRTLEPDIPIGFLQSQITKETIETVAKTPNASLHTHYRSLSVELLTVAKHLGVPLLAYTVNEPHIAHALLQAGIFALFSDHPPAYLFKAGFPVMDDKDSSTGTFEHPGMLLS